MNPQYMPQQLGAPPPQNYAPMKQNTGINQPGHNNDQNQPPFGYKPATGQMNNVPLNTPTQMQPGMPPMMNPANMPGQMPLPGSYGPPRVNGPSSMGPPGQFQGQIRSPSQSQQRPMYAPTPMGTSPRPMGPPLTNQTGIPPMQMPPTMGPPVSQMPPTNSMGPPPSQMPPISGMGPQPNQMGGNQMPPVPLMGPQSGSMGHTPSQMPPLSRMAPSPIHMNQMDSDKQSNMAPPTQIGQKTEHNEMVSSYIFFLVYKLAVYIFLGPEYLATNQKSQILNSALHDLFQNLIYQQIIEKVFEDNTN